MFADDQTNGACFCSVGVWFYSGCCLSHMRTLAQFHGKEMSLGLSQDFMVFVSSVTQRNEDAGSAQDFVLFFIFAIDQEI